MFILSSHNSILYMKSPNFPESVRHGFSMRLGGVSGGSYRSLNLGLHVRDDSRNVLENRRRWTEVFGVSLSNAVVAEQVHGAKVQVVGKSDWGRGSYSVHDAVSECDALISREPGTCLMCFYADCVPLFFYHPITGAVGLAHAGWKGTLAQIGKETVKAFSDNFDVPPEELSVAIGPSIGPCCYEISDELSNKFVEFFGLQVRTRDCFGTPHLDLWLANFITLVESGVKPENIVRADFCTACHPGLFYSYRFSQGETGRMAAFIQVPGRS